MSTDASHARVVFPQVGLDGRGDVQDRGYIQGHAAGYAAGLRAAAAEQEQLTLRLQSEHNAAMASARRQTDDALAVLGAAAAAFRQRFQLVLQDAEEVLAASALDLAEAVLGHELNDDDGGRGARAALRRALPAGTLDNAAPGAGGPGAPSQGGAPAAVRLHPVDIAVLKAAGLAEGAGVELVPDSSLERGDAMAQYPEGWLDARLGTALARARATLLRPELPAQPGQPGTQPLHGNNGEQL